MMKKCTQQDLRFWKNKGSKRSKDNRKGGQHDQKSKNNWYKILENGQMTYFVKIFDHAV